MLAPVRRGLNANDLATFLELPIVAILATYRHDGTVLLSPVWHEWRDGGFNVATSAGDVKARHVARHPQASLVVAESAPPYRGVEVRRTPRLVPTRRTRSAPAWPCATWARSGAAPTRMRSAMTPSSGWRPRRRTTFAHGTSPTRQLLRS